MTKLEECIAPRPRSVHTFGPARASRAVESDSDLTFSAGRTAAVTAPDPPGKPLPIISCAVLLFFLSLSEFG